MKNEMSSWTICQECQGLGKKRRKLRKKVRLQYKIALDIFEKSNTKIEAPMRPKGQLYNCSNCNGSGLISAKNHPIADTEHLPHVAIIGGGIGGTALAVACLHRGIPFTLFERDSHFKARSQGYGLTLQQASTALKGFGIHSLEKGVVSTKHIVHNTDGKVIGEWGKRKWVPTETEKTNKKTNIHIARQSLRLALLEQLGAHNTVQWNHQLIDFKTHKTDGHSIQFKVDNTIKNVKADLIVGADGIRSTVRKLLFGETVTPLRYLDCIVILGICPLKNIEKDIDTTLLDSETVFQTANGNERIYMMPYDAETIMWQLSFPMNEKKAIVLSKQGPKALKKEAYKRTQWHEPIPQILEATEDLKISGYPVYDRKLLQAEWLENKGAVTLLGDAAHPMSPFKGQGANQALLDALALARGISRGCRPLSQWRAKGIRKSVLTKFEAEMLKRSSKKVKDSAKSVDLLHSDKVLIEGNAPRGRDVKA
ncbi:FAD-dependent oxidoreductase [Lacinutrix sp.]|uniref:FAD-dependent oxidoreductase n=1 Tax=Lacinutrix sp. TaxID=1937692 RepID=UPI0035C82EB5